MKVLASHWQAFATTVDLDGVVRTVEGKHRTERICWALICCLAAITAFVLTSMVSLNYTNGTPYQTSYSVESSDGLVSFPDILLCTSSLWDLEKVHQYGLSSDLLAYLLNFIFPFGGFGSSGTMEATAEFYDLEKEYQTVLEKFDRNALYLLHNITMNCSQILQSCIFGANYRAANCCEFFNLAEFTLSQMCFRTNEKLLFAVQEAGMLNSIEFRVMLRSGSVLNSSVINPAAIMFRGQLATAVLDKDSHTYLSLSRQVRCNTKHWGEVK